MTIEDRLVAEDRVPMYRHELVHETECNELKATVNYLFLISYFKLTLSRVLCLYDYGLTEGFMPSRLS